MIQLYKRENTEYDWNGDFTLDAESCQAKAELNGSWELEIVLPLDERETFLELQPGAVLSVPTFVGEDQLYRIYREYKTHTTANAFARPIFLDSARDVFLLDRRPTEKNGQQALNELVSGSKYQAISDIVSVNTAYYIRKNLMEAIAGKNEMSFLNRWGGEILYRNYTIEIDQRIGEDRNVRAEFGRNLESIKEEINIDAVVTRIVPIAYNGRMLSGDTPWVDSPLINSYPVVHIKLIEFPDLKLQEDIQSEEEKGYATLGELQQELIRQCNLLYENGLDKPLVKYEINMVDLSRTEEYKDFAVLETIKLGDTIHCYHRKLGIETDARVIALQYDCIRRKYGKITLGNYKKSYFDRVDNAVDRVDKIDQIIDSDGNIMADHVAGILNGMKTQLKVQNSAAKKQEVRAILFEDLDPESPMYGAMSIGTQGFQISDQRTADDSDWVWKTAATSHAMVADAMITGLISDKAGRNYWNLDTGEFNMSSSSKIEGEEIGDKLTASRLASIIGDAYAFKYNAENQLSGPSSITLAAQLKGVSMSKWQYMNTTGIWTNYPTTEDNASITDYLLVIKPNHEVFVKDTARIKLVTDDENVYDVVSITKLYDGKNGEPGKDGNPGADGSPGADGEPGKDAAIMSDTQPEDTTRLWCDTSVSPPVIKAYNEVSGEWLPVNDQTDQITEVVEQLNSSINKTSEEIRMEVRESYYAKGEVDQLLEETSTELNVRSDGLEVQISQVSQDVADSNAEYDTEFENLKKWFRFTADGAEIGQEGQALALALDNDLIAFKKNGVAIAYWDGSTLHTGDLNVDVNNQARFGPIAIVPRSDGTVMFLEVGE